MGRALSLTLSVRVLGILADIVQTFLQDKLVNYLFYKVVLKIKKDYGKRKFNFFNTYLNVTILFALQLKVTRSD